MLTEIVLPNDTNSLGNLMGGRLLHWMDIAATISSQRHCGRVVVTASVNNVSFTQPIKLEEIVTYPGKDFPRSSLPRWKCILTFGWKTPPQVKKKKMQ